MATLNNSWSLLILVTILSLRITTAENSDYVDTKAIQAELRQLKSRIALLESNIAQRTKLKNADDSVEEMEKNILEKSDSASKLHNDGEYMRDVKRESDFGMQNKKTDAFEDREKPLDREGIQLVREQSLVFATYLVHHTQSLVEITYEVYNVLRNSSVNHFITVLHSLSDRVSHLKSSAVTHWDEHLRPAINVTFHKAMEKGSQVKNWADPLATTIKTDWMPLVKDQLLAYVMYLKQHVQPLSGTAIQVYSALMSSTSHHFVMVQHYLNPYFEQYMIYAKPYINHIVAATTPILDELRATLKPYTITVADTYREVSKAAIAHYYQAQERLETNKLTKLLAAMSLSWSKASAILILPVTYIIMLFLAIFSKKARKQSRASHSKNRTRRNKRRYQDL